MFVYYGGVIRTDKVRFRDLETGACAYRLWHLEGYLHQCLLPYPGSECGFTEDLHTNSVTSLLSSVVPRFLA